MSESTAVVETKDQWVLLQKQCKAFIASGFLPDHITQGASQEQIMAKAITIAVKGRELGIPPMQAFNSITVIKGKPCLSAELMLALIYQRVKGAKVTFVTPPEKQSTECTVEMLRPGGSPQRFSFTMEDAKRAGLVIPKSAWEKYPAAMLRARAVSAGARAVFPDAIMGCYTPEEMGGEVIDVDPMVETPTTETPKATERPDTRPAPTTGPRNKSTGGTIKDWDRANPNWVNEPSTESQRKKLWAMAKELGWTEDDVKDVILDSFHKESTKDLTKSEIQQLFKDMEYELQERHEVANG